MEQQQIRSALSTCGFEESEERDFIVDTEFGDWNSFALVNLDVFAAIGDRLASAGYRVTTTQMLNLSVFKFCVEDKDGMKEHIAFKIFKQERDEYFPLYQAFLTAQHMNSTVPNGPKFSINNFNEFYSGK